MRSFFSAVFKIQQLSIDFDIFVELARWLSMNNRNLQKLIDLLKNIYIYVYIVNKII